MDATGSSAGLFLAGAGVRWLDGDPGVFALIPCLLVFCCCLFQDLVPLVDQLVVFFLRCIACDDQGVYIICVAVHGYAFLRWLGSAGWGGCCWSMVVVEFVDDVGAL